MIAAPSLSFLKLGSAGAVATTLVHIDDDFAWGETLRKSVSALPSAVSMRVVEACTRAHGLRLCLELCPSIIVMELWLQGEDGFELLEQLVALPGKPRVLALTRRCDPVAMHRARAGRLAGWVWKTAAAGHQLGAAFVALRAGETYFPPEVCAEMARLRAAQDAFFKIISPTERKLLPLLGRGWTDEAVARRLVREPCTIKRHRLTIQKKFGLRREELPLWAMQVGFVPPLLLAPPRPIVD